ncbi:type II toxin-antitoxin system PemK/MazF family toxin [Candidatus Woesearchaeota archaeon]|nr:type II toxin-antitoxin system PemK/MazF family toxin [Candidatus Woesearchaeota archaeon]
MERFVKGEVVVLPFPYTDLSSAKKRPALVIAVLKGDNLILAQITTNKRDDEDLVNLNKNDFASGFLKCDSFIMPSIIFTADTFKIEYKIGRLKQEKIKEVQDKLCEIFVRN